MNLIIENDYDALTHRVARMIIHKVEAKPDLVIGLITGSTPIGLYQKLIKMQPNFSEVISFNVDEYLDLSRQSLHSYHYFMKKNLFNYLDFAKTFIPQSDNDPAKACQDYEKKIKQFGGIDLQILGIGKNGHIAFNEPGTSFDSRTHVARLSKSTIKANSCFFNHKEKMPKKAITMGIGTLMEAKEIILLASGKAKALACKKAINGPITTEVPASVLQKHKKTTIILDKEAASLL